MLELLGRYAGNGLTEARRAAEHNMVDYLKHESVVGPDDRVLWGKLLDLVMAPKG